MSQPLRIVCPLHKGRNKNGKQLSCWIWNFLWQPQQLQKTLNYNVSSISVYTSQDVLYIVLNLRSQHRGVQSIPYTHSHSWHVKNTCVISKYAYCYSCASQEKQLFTNFAGTNQEILSWSQSTSWYWPIELWHDSLTHVAMEITILGCMGLIMD